MNYIINPQTNKQVSIFIIIDMYDKFYLIPPAAGTNLMQRRIPPDHGSDTRIAYINIH